MSKTNDKNKQSEENINKTEDELTDEQLDNVSGGFSRPWPINREILYIQKRNPYYLLNNEPPFDWDKIVEKN